MHGADSVPAGPILRRRVVLSPSAMVDATFALTAAEASACDPIVAAALASGRTASVWSTALTDTALLKHVAAFHECDVRGNAIVRIPARLNSGYVPGLGFMSHDAFVAVATGGHDGALTIQEDLVDVTTVPRSKAFGAVAGGPSSAPHSVASDGTWQRWLPRVRFAGSGSLMSTHSVGATRTALLNALGPAVTAAIASRSREESWPSAIATLSGRDDVRSRMVEYVGFLEHV